MLGISEAAATVGVSPGTLRLWEAEGLITPARDASGARTYSDRDIAQIERIHHLRTVNRLNAAAIRQVLGLSSRPSDSRQDGFAIPDLRARRLAAGLTIKETARRAGLSLSFLSAVERGLAGASPGTVTRILSAFGETGPWFDSSAQLGPVRSGGGKQVQVTREIRNEWLADQPGLLEVIRRTIEPGGDSGGPQEHEGEEFILVLAGVLAVQLAGTEYTLGAGDSLYYPSHIVHQWRNEGPATVTVLWVSTEVGIWSNLALSTTKRHARRAHRRATNLVDPHVLVSAAAEITESKQEV